LADPVFRGHLAGRNHPERAERFDAVMEGLRTANLMDALIPVAARAATEEELLLCHTI
jgi:acetoin utilization deacetylase AcuC-like enzyme